VTEPYVRVYQSIVEDPKFVGIVDDDHHLATWLRMLMAADASWPLASPLPAKARRASIKALTEAGIIDVTGPRFRIHGLDAERGRRSEKAKASADKRWSDRSATAVLPHSEGNARASSSSLVSVELEEPAREPDDGRVDLEAFLLLTRRAPTPRQRALLDGLLDRHDLTGPKWAADVMMRHPDDPIGAVIAADKAYRAERIAEAQAQEVPKPQPRRARGLPEHTKELLAHWEAQKRSETPA
jgi:hypothetical protein